MCGSPEYLLGGEDGDVLYRFQNCRVDDKGRTLHRDGVAVAVEPKAFDLLLHLIRNSTRVVNRQELLESVWYGATVSQAAINRCIMIARQAIGDHDPEDRLISTVHGRGFRFTAKVTVADPSGTMWLPAAEIPGVSLPLEPPTGPFAGRVDELQRIHLAWRHSLARQRQAILVAGEPGIGKTRLAMEGATRAQSEGALILFGHCDDELGVPFQPFLEALDRFLRWCPPSSLRALLGRFAGELQRLLPEIGQLLPGIEPAVHSDAETQRFRLFSAVADWLREVSRNVPVVLVLDDLHWATRETILLFRHVVRALPNERLLIVATYRDTDVHDTPILGDALADVQREHGVQHLTLGGLDPQNVSALLAAARGSASDDALANEVCSYAQGNALFVSEIIRHLHESGELALAARAGRFQIPVGLRATVQRRVRRLSEACRDFLSWACVVGVDISQRLLESLLEQPYEALVEYLDPACQARILEPVGASHYRFTHRLVREALYEELGPAQRSLRHRKVAMAIEAAFAADLDPHLPALAFHFGLGGDELRAKATDYAIRAGDRARQRLAHDQAAEHYAAAIEFLDAPLRHGPAGVDLLIRLGEAQRDSGNVAYRETLLLAAKQAQRMGDGDRLARAALANSIGWAPGIFLRDDERVAILDAALQTMDAADSVIRARLLANLMGELSFANAPERLRALDAEALGMARRLGDPATLSYVMRSRAMPLWTPDLFHERRALSAEHLAIAHGLGDPLERWWAWHGRLSTAIEAAEMGEAEACLQELRSLTPEIGQPWLRWQLENLECCWALQHGQMEHAEILADRALELGVASGRTDAMAFYLVHLSSLRFMQGRVEEILPQLGSLIDNGDEARGVRAVVADGLSELGQHAEAAAIVDAEAQHRFSQFPYESGRLSSLMHYARACFYIGAQDAAAILYERLEPWSGQVIYNGVSLLGTVDACLGVLAATAQKPDAAEMHLQAADAIHERMSLPYWKALLWVDWATVSAQQGARQRAVDLAGQAGGLAQQHGFGTVARRSTAILEASRAANRRGPSRRRPARRSR